MREPSAATSFWPIRSMPMPVILLALDASVVLASAKGQRVVPFGKMIEEHPWRFVGKKSIVTEIRFPTKMASWGSSYQRFARTSRVGGAILLAATMECREGKCQSVRIALGGVERRIARFLEAEKIAAGQRLTKEICRKAGQLVAEKINPMSDWRSSKEYRKEIVGVLVARALQEACGCAN